MKSTPAVALAMVVSRSLVRRRHRLSRAKVLLTTHRRGRSSNPSAVSERLTVRMVHFPILSRYPFSWSGIAPLGEGMPQLRVARAEGLERRGRAIAILNIGGMDNQSGQVCRASQ